MDSALRTAIILTFFKRDALKTVLGRIRIENRELFNTLTHLLPKAAELVHTVRQHKRNYASNVNAEFKDFPKINQQTQSSHYSITRESESADEVSELVDIVIQRNSNLTQDSNPNIFRINTAVKLPFRIIED